VEDWRRTKVVALAVLGRRGIRLERGKWPQGGTKITDRKSDWRLGIRKTR